MKITNCKTNHILLPIGYQMDSPVFSWMVEEAHGKRQSAARIRVALDADFSSVLTDTGWAELDSLATSVEIDLKPRTRYFWTVAVRSDAGEEAESPVNFFETGKRDEPWQAKWITCEKQERHPVFHKQISVSKPLASARLYICGLGLYEASINGMRVGDEYLTPYCNNYSAWLQSQTYDVTDELRQGGELSVLLADGWYAGRFGYSSKPGDPGYYGNERKLIAEIRLLYADDTEDVIGTDDSWTVTRSTITFSNIYDGEHRDDTLVETEQEKVFITNENAPLTDRYSLPVKVYARIKPVELIHTPSGETVLDLGQNQVGIFELHLHEKPGTEVHLQFAEVLQNGNFYNENYRTALSEYRYICGDGETVLQPRFSFFGYRYVKIEGVESLKAEDYTALVLCSDLPEAGSLSTGHPLVNRLIENVIWGQAGNFLDVPTDCPQRDERLGWTGDAQVFSATACFLRESYAFYRKYLHDMNTEQAALDGKVPDVVPSFGPIYQGCSSVWGDAACIIPWNVYRFYGDKSILADCYDGMKAWVEYVRRIDGTDFAWGRHFHYGDWLALDHPSGRADECLGGTEERYIAYVYLLNSVELTFRAAAVLGKSEDEKKYKAFAEKLRQELRAEYFAPNGRCVCDTQTGLLLALQYDLTPNPIACYRRLEEKLKLTGGKLQTGFVGTPFLSGQLCRAGMERQAYDLLLNEEYPGWLYEVKLGATTIWERWNSLNPDGSISSTGMNSFNHYSYGAIAEWMFRYMAGLNQVEPGFRRVHIAPIPDRRIGYVDMSYKSAAGVYRVFWETKDDTTLHLRMEIPFGCEALVKLPYSEETEQTLGTGSYEWTYTTTQPMRRVFHADMRLDELLGFQKLHEVMGGFIPEIINIPHSMRYMTLRELLSSPQFGGIQEQTIQKLDQALREVM